jgi:hypothetical protein
MNIPRFPDNEKYQLPNDKWKMKFPVKLLPHRLFQFGEHPLRPRRRGRLGADLFERAPRRTCEERPGE